MEYLQPDKFKERSNFDPKYQVSYFFFFAGDASCFHVFPGKGRVSLSAQGKKVMFSGKKIPSFQIIRQRSCAGATSFGKTIFSEGLKKILYFRVFF